jgi:hypothetical protein
MENEILYPAAEFVINKAVRCGACGKPTTAVQYDRPSGTVKTACKCGGSPFQNIIPATAGTMATA